MSDDFEPVLNLNDSESGALSRDWLEGGMAILDSSGQILDLNAPLSEWLGEGAQYQGQDFASLLAGRHPHWAIPLKNAFQTSEVFSQQVLSSEASNPGRWYSLELVKSPPRWIARLNSTLPSAADLREISWEDFSNNEAARRKMYLRLMRSEDQLQNLASRWPGVIFSQRADFSFHYVSPKMEEFTGLPPAVWEQEPQKFWEVVHETDAEELKQQIRRTARLPQGATTTYRIRNQRNGRVFYVMEHRRARTSGNGLILGYEGVWLDVTRQTIAEKRLTTAAWKETLGVLTMGLAHDFSNIMAGIHSLSESFLSQVDHSHPFQEGLQLIKQHSMQASQLVHRIIQLHHGKTGNRNYHDLNQVITEVIDLARKILSRRISIKTQFAGDALALYMDSVEFCQVILNLALNAADAMPQGGELLFATSRHTEMPALDHIEGNPPRLPAICLMVKDTGCGIPTRHLKAIFDPFFTTKAMNKGSGLGLYNTRLFVEKHWGAISVDSVEAEGTTFRIWLPEADFTEADRLAMPSDSHRSSILLAGAGGAVCEGTIEFLRSHGYHVVTAHTPDQALEILDTVEYPLVALWVIEAAGARGLAGLIPAARRKKYGLKTILQIIGCNQDELDHQVLKETDLVIGADWSENAIANKLKVVLEPRTA